MNSLDKKRLELLDKGLLELSEEGLLVLSEKGRAELSEESLQALLYAAAAEVSDDEQAYDPAAEEQLYEEIEEQLNGSWEERQNDPDNWLEIPEFGVLPQDVYFKGFAFPILGADVSDAGWRRPVWQAVRAVRKEARRRFDSLRQLLEAYRGVVAELDTADRARKWSANEMFAFEYQAFFRYLRQADSNYRRAKAQCIQDLARALETATYICSGDLPRPDFVSRVQSAQGKRAAEARHAKDPKQAAKKNVKDCWLAWQRNPARYKGKAKFARDMLEKYPDLENNRVIEDWCRDWEREALLEPSRQGTQSAG